MPYGTTAELLIHYLFKGKYLNPDYIIYHGGGNDSMTLFFPDYQTDYSHVRWTTSGLKIQSPFDTVIKNSYFAKLVLSIIFKGDIFNGDPGFSNITPSDSLKRTNELDSIAFKENLEVLVNESLRNKTQVFFIGFLQAKKNNLTKNRPDLKGFEDSLILGAMKHDNIMYNIAKKHKHVFFLKLDLNKFKDEWFQDNCHLTEEGEIEKSEQIFDFIKNKISFDKREVKL